MELKYPATRYAITGLNAPIEPAMTKKMMDEMCEATISPGTGISTNTGYGSATSTGSTGSGSGYGTISNGNGAGGGGGSTLTGTISYSGYASSPAMPTFIYTYSSSTEESAPAVAQSDSPDLPPMVFNTFDENGNTVKMTVAPEASISASDVMKMCMLINMMTISPDSFSALAYVKKNGLARHFTYSS